MSSNNLLSNESNWKSQSEIENLNINIRELYAALELFHSNVKNILFQISNRVEKMEQQVLWLQNSSSRLSILNEIENRKDI